MFTVELESTLQNKETDAEPSTTVKESVIKLSCHIDNNNKPIDHLAEGLKISLEGDLDRYSPVLGRNAVYSKKAAINRLVINVY